MKISLYFGDNIVFVIAATLFLCLWMRCLPLSAQPEPGTWAHYKAVFVSSDGRVIDHYQDQCSHSEGQGYGMLLSVQQDDHETFTRIFRWTRNNLMVRQDDLAAWKWGRRSNGSWGVIDYNNATDGDILIAWAALLANRNWQIPEYLIHVEKTLRSIKANLIIDRKKKNILLPGYFGFVEAHRVRINPSYFVFPAFQTFAEQDSDGEFWKSLERTCLDLIQSSSFSRLQLPADWISLQDDGSLSIAEPHGTYFRYEAIRVPLYLAMSSHREMLNRFGAYLKLSHQMGYLPQSVNLQEEMVSLQEASAGFNAVMGRCASALGMGEISGKLMDRADHLIRMEKRDYYSATLYLLAKTMVMP